MSPKSKPETLSMRLSEDGKLLLTALQQYYGLSQSSVVELILREQARAVGLSLDALRNPKRPR